MLYASFGTPMPETKEEFWELYQDSRMKFVPMWDEANRETECPSYEVVAMLMRGWNLQPWMPERKPKCY